MLSQLKRLGRRYRAAVSTTSLAAPLPPARALSTIKVEGKNFVFGLDWRLLPPTRRLSRSLALAREEGQSWYALSELEDVAGFQPSPGWLRGTHHSASLHLATKHSQGGLELFALTFSEEVHAVIALQESRPLPGFDFLGDPATAKAMVEDFLAIQRGQPIRLVGNTDYLDGQERVAPDDLFVEPASSTRLRSLRSWRAVRRGLAALTLIAVAGVGLDRWLEQRRQDTQAQLYASAAYQQKVYKEGLSVAWASVPPPSDEVIRYWYASIAGLPLRVRGWHLSHLECDISECKAHWWREHGSYADFLSNLPAGTTAIDQSAVDSDPLVGKLATRHALNSAAASAAVPLTNLPDLLTARRELADLFHDLELLGNTVGKVEPATLFGGQQDPQKLVDAVFSGRWVLQQDVWVLSSLKLPTFARAQTLRVVLQPEIDAERRASSEDSVKAPTEPFFELTGTYYARQ